ncbi:MAG TPA: hypothetical protein PK052_05550 [Anaerohalosphaeraceae bacterium]|nr:hypothetical protein [Anaerohalosphaeraceae bacterium]HOM76391.1 hypothetical protein [Anaerohalosphaeraceae bacterium]HPC64161.1 hypothetical protein [Anaerohalosphaeraceae bacterium]HPO70082.1 hypothetical protein [Anaerohalosphaeraceae bacterium]HRS71181.1 hypothetical protein [Anaerohalosphaeraceae bacterium]
MKKLVQLICLFALLTIAGAASAATLLIDLRADDLPEGDLRSWTNQGAAGGVFTIADRPDDGIVDPNAVVQTVAGRKAVTFAGGAWMQSDITAPAGLTGAHPWTVMVWAYATSTTGEDCLFQWGDRGGGTAHFNFGTRAITFWNDVFYTNAPALNQWVHLAATYDGTNVRLYVNGTDDTVAARSLNINTGNYMRIARAMPNLWGTHPFGGAIASIQAYDAALTKQEIQVLTGLFEAGSLSPTGVSVRENGPASTIYVQINTNPITGQGPQTDLEVTLSLISTQKDIQLGTSPVGQPYVITVPAASYQTPIPISVLAEDDDIIESQHAVRVRAVVTAGDPDYLGKILVPNNGLAITVIDNDYTPCTAPGLTNGAYVDHFDCKWDYTQGPSSMWSGLMDTAGYTTDATSSISAAGALRLASANAFWSGNDTTGPYLYIDVTGDFEVETYISEYANSIAGQDGVLHNAGGIMVRLADPAAGGAGEDNIQASYFPIWGCGNILWYHNNGARTETDIADTAWDGSRYLKVVRKGAAFYCYHSPDGNTWIPFPSANPMIRQDMNVPTLQVGLYQCTFNNTLGFVDYDYFSLKKVRGHLTGTLNLTECDADAGTVQFQFETDGVKAPIADINVTVYAVAASGADPNSDPNDVVIGTAEMGQPYTFTVSPAQYSQPQLIQVAAVADATPEPDQLLTLQAQIASTDPNWNGLLISSDVLIHVMETPGLLLDTGDGVRVAEGDGPDTFTVRLKIPPLAWPVSVNITNAAGQVTVDPAQLSFDAASWKTPQVVTVSAVDDAVLEADPHATTLTLTAANGNEYDALAPLTVSVSILENECGAWGYVWGDFNRDCKVDVADLSEMAAAWLDCTNPYDTGCVDLR